MASYGHLYSSFFKAADFSDGEREFTITKVKPVKMSRDSDEEKLVIYVDEDERGIPLNVGRYKSAVDIFETDDVDKWVGGKIKCVPSKTKFQGRTVASFDLEA